ncbi:MAG: PEP-CTERM sorting domain-containing protein [Phycisphaerae bacterium]
MSTKRMILGMIVLMALVGTARASPVTFEFAGEITSVLDDEDFLGGAVTVGSPFSGSFTFESTTPDSYPGSPWSAAYPDAITAISGQIGGIPFLGPVHFENIIGVLNDAPASGTDHYEVHGGVGFVSETLMFSLVLFDDTGRGLSNDLLPLSPPDIRLFDFARFAVSDETIPLGLGGDITSLTPDPGTLALLGLGALIVTRRRRTRRVRTNGSKRR